ncbi:MAG: hypothetical protein PHY35_03175 [Candidatus Omnitrophica bacterium]|nr:hypothetical protein [Candidatus Omnitrophota bacterium]
MQNKDEIIDQFFRSFKVTLTNSFSYSKDHPYFIKSVETFKSKLDEILAVLNPFKIGVTNTGLIVDGENLNKTGFYDEIARLFHQRKIKSIEIGSNISIEELVGFFSVISLSQKDIFKKGGIRSLLKENRLVNLVIEELDYSAFLQSSGQECADIWGYMLKEAALSNDAEKIEKMADDFGSFIKRSSEKDIVENEEMPANIRDFLSALKEKNIEKFNKCSREAFMWLLHNKNTLNAEKLEKLKPVFDSLDQENFSKLLWEGLTHEDNFDGLSLQLFSKISEQKNELKIAEGFLNKVNQSITDNPNIVKKIKNLLSAVQGKELSAVYHNILESLIKDTSTWGGMVFDERQLRENYRYIILSMLATDKIDETLKLAASSLEKEFSNIIQDNSFIFLKELSDVLAQRRPENIGVCIELEKKLSACVENIVLGQTLSSEQEFLVDLIRFPSQGVDFYLDKIFAESKANKQILVLFFKFFQDRSELFYNKLGERLQDMEFLTDLVRVLSQFEIPASPAILEYIYSSANELIKLDALNVMRRLKNPDRSFLKNQLSFGSFQVRKSVCSILITDENSKNSVLELLRLPSPFGRKNNLLMENMQIIYELEIRDAVKDLQELGRRKFFWNSKLRNKAKQILKEWNVL